MPFCGCVVVKDVATPVLLSVFFVPFWAVCETRALVTAGGVVSVADGC